MAETIVETSYCSKCNKNKPIASFCINRQRKSGLNGICKSCKKSYDGNNLEGNRNRKLKSNFGLTLKQYNAILNSQNGRCAICGQKEVAFLHGKVKNLSVDHNHSCCSGVKSCGKCVRGLLCHKCNIAIGLLGDDLTLLQRAIHYIEGANRV